MTRKCEISRTYPPDYVSCETLAYRLDLARSTVDDWVRRGLLPKPTDHRHRAAQGAGLTLRPAYPLPTTRLLRGT